MKGTTLSARPPLPSRRGAPPPKRANAVAKALVFVALFGGLVALSFYLRSSNRLGSNAAAGPPAKAVIVQPSLPGVTPTPAASGGPPIDSPLAGQLCRGPNVLKAGFTLDAAFMTNAQTAAAWEDNLSSGSLHSELHSLDPSIAVAVCYLDGPWEAPPNVATYYAQMGETPNRGIMFVPQTGAPIPGPIAPTSSLPILKPVA